MPTSAPRFGVKEISQAGTLTTIVQQRPDKHIYGVIDASGIIEKFANENGYKLLSLDNRDSGVSESGAYWNEKGEIVRLEIYNDPEYIPDAFAHSFPTDANATKTVALQH